MRNCTDGTTTHEVHTEPEFFREQQQRRDARYPKYCDVRGLTVVTRGGGGGGGGIESDIEA